MKSEYKNNVEKVLESAMEKLSAVNGNQVVGAPIKNECGQVVIPVSNLTMAVFSGGGEYGDYKVSKAIGEHFAGGGITVYSLKPTHYLVDNGAGFSVVKPSETFESIVSIIKNICDKL